MTARENCRRVRVGEGRNWRRVFLPAHMHASNLEVPKNATKPLNFHNFIALSFKFNTFTPSSSISLQLGHNPPIYYYCYLNPLYLIITNLINQII